MLVIEDMSSILFNIPAARQAIENHAVNQIISFLLLLLQVLLFFDLQLIFCMVFVFPFSEQCIEAYELLLALAESEQSLILGQFRAAGVGSVGKMSMNHLRFFLACQLALELAVMVNHVITHYLRMLSSNFLFLNYLNCFTHPRNRGKMQEGNINSPVYAIMKRCLFW